MTAAAGEDQRATSGSAEASGRPLRSLVLAPFIGFDTGNSRPRILAEALARFGPVDVVTTNFEHALKARRPDPHWPVARHIVQLPTPAYHANVSVARFRSHIAFSRAATRYVRMHGPEYDVVYATAPLNLLASSAFAAVPHALRILDVIDVWPDVLPFPPLVRRIGWPIFAGWKALFAQACGRADVLLTVSDRFLDEGRRWFRGSPTSARRFYIGHPTFPEVDAEPLAGQRRRIAYVGNVGQLYDFETLLDALALPEFRDAWELHVVGRGGRDEWLRAELARRGIAHVHHGLVSDPVRLATILAPCVVGFNGYRNTTAAFSYKATTYLAAGLPLLNSMTGDLARLVDEHQIGANYAEGDVASLVSGLARIASEDPTALRARCREFFAAEIEADALAGRLHAFLAAEVACPVAERAAVTERAA